MRILIDEDVHIKVLSWLRENGHDVIRVPAGTKNGQVIALAQKESRVLVTRDTDFSNRLLYPPSKYKGIVVMRIHPPKLENLLLPLEKLFQELPEASFCGKLIVLEAEGFQLLG